MGSVAKLQGRARDDTWVLGGTINFSGVGGSDVEGPGMDCRASVSFCLLCTFLSTSESIHTPGSLDLEVILGHDECEGRVSGLA